MDTREGKKRETLDHNKYILNKRKMFSIVMVFMFLLQLFLPVGLAFATSGTSESQESSIVEIEKEKDVEEKANVHSKATKSSMEETKKPEEKSSLESSNLKEQESSSAESKEADSSKPVEKPAEESSSQESVPTQPEESSSQESVPTQPEESSSQESVPSQPEESSSQESTPPKSEVVEEDDVDLSEESSEEVAESKESKEESKEEESKEESKEEDIEDPEESFIGFDGVDPSLAIGSTNLLYFTKGSSNSANSKNRMGVIETQIDGLLPGEIRTNKTAERVPGTVNTWDIEVLIEGRDDEKTETTDVVLVIDRSGSMKGQRLIDAKTAANNFIETMLTRDPNLRIALVSFAGPNPPTQAVTVESGFSQNKSFLKGKVNGLVANGGTHTQAGIIQGRILLNGPASTADNKFMVLLSDGEPTYSYEPQNWENNVGTYKNGIYNGNFNVNKTVGTGNSIDRYYDNGSGTPRYRYINNGFAAIKQGQIARVGIDSLYTIATNTTTLGEQVLTDIASPGKAYRTQNSGDLTQIYDQIAGEISTQFALREATVIDEMGDGFTLIDGSIVTTEGTTTVAGASDPNNQTINWDLSAGVTKVKLGFPKIKYAKMTYRVEINESMASIGTADGTTDHTKFKTNKVTELTYKDSDGGAQEKSITSPEVDPVLLKIKKILLDEAGNEVNDDARKFNVQITNGGSGFDTTTNLVGGEGYQILTTLRKEGTYNIEEIGIDGSATDLNKFNISYDINENATTSFEVNHEGEIPRGDVIIEVTNAAITQAIDFTFTKMDGSDNTLEGSEFTLEKQNGEGEPILIENTGTDPIFTFAGLNEGVYILTEIKASLGYKLPTGTWTITVVRNIETGLLELQIPDNSFITGDKDTGYEVENEQQSEFPQTGGIGSLTYIMIGLIIVMSSLTLSSNIKQKIER
ncbi:VWA domain-containing protein [Jeotgalibaca sp. MA1X17-3]|uniref:VWA domain-containing protein n=1 Tax=Jeotgalibaca sp. MA1X17-3 TaxID=2908211 RepID=UPI001F486F11|nr:VWA domain-containing protein [Jeotgalibaca sp. MA1X17-3]UJF16295.1 VWA domain-containing protein [Jeotgalibaca sp. MA1X17-3]